MLVPEELESAEADGYYVYNEIEPDRISLSTQVKNSSPNFYELLTNFSDQFERTKDTIKPINEVILDDYVLPKEQTINNERLYGAGSITDVPVKLTILVTGSLQVKGETVIDGNMTVTYDFYIDE